ncbi:hypothetical protein [Pararhodobacter oceanensis]|uniref:Uncharacterized protein n=1 Tax=Pararhodobacter oceanensis TaxID=2172121 RepID=A0A2T8HS80_9RHOB|nr:hypothetical protein [Pararhodobacter oceanensis]PVH28233.1 hypothetical protein DDE20_14110 [Pararhodobacter oceanensis]
MRSPRFVYLLVLLWVIAFAASILLTMSIDGPRNLDTGFARLDTLARGQLVALGIAIVSAVAALLLRGAGWLPRLIGLTPMLVTLAIIAAFTAAMLLYQPTPPETPATPPRAPVTEPGDSPTVEY